MGVSEEKRLEKDRGSRIPPFWQKRKRKKNESETVLDVQCVHSLTTKAFEEDEDKIAKLIVVHIVWL